MPKNANNKTPNKIRNRLENVLTIILFVFSICLFAVSGILIFQKTYYESFWVNGQSMYPTLNKDVKGFDGQIYGTSGGGIHNDGAYNVDYGIMDTHKYAINKIKRFDLVVCKFPESTDNDLIKRVIALPGETFRFVLSGERKGQIDVKKGGEYVPTNVPVDSSYIKSCDYSSLTSEITLGENEYYVCGDNRANSSDSRKYGKLAKANIEGKVVAIIAKCEAYRFYNEKISDYDYTIRNVKYFSWPRFI